MTKLEKAEAAKAAREVAWVETWARAYDTEIAKSAALSAQTIEEWAAAKIIFENAKIAESAAQRKLKEAMR
jgi:hypothetical protein